MKTSSQRMLIGILVLTASACSTQPAGEHARAGAVEGGTTDANSTRPRVVTPSEVTAAIADRVDALADDEADGAVRDYYAARNDTPAWFDRDGAPRDAIAVLLDALSRADRQGLVVADYRTTALARRIDDARATGDTPDADTLAALDVQLSRTFVAYARDLHEGRVHGGELRPRWANDLTPADYVGALERAARDGDVDAALSALRPPHDGYTKLVKALADYRAIVDAGGWPAIADGPTLAAGQRDPRVPALRRRLTISGDIPPRASAGDAIDDGVAALDTPPREPDAAPAHASTRYDDTISAGVRAFQRRHGLAVDGRLGPATRAALNVPATARVRQIEVNLERWRWLPADLGERYVMVNIPDYRLRAFEAGRPALDMPVVVGKSYDDRATPVFTDRMQYVIFRPYWNVPPGIAADEIVPEARRDAGYLAARHYEIVPVFGPNAEPLEPTPERLDAVAAGKLYVRQRAGASNALGLVKFMFPNEYAVYLHDSPAERLFARNERDFSHGCVRVADPAALAQFVLADKPDWDAARIDRALHEGRRQRVDLAASIPVYLIYWTAFVDEAGVQFRPDLYEHDPPVEKALQQAGARAAGAAGHT